MFERYLAATLLFTTAGAVGCGSRSSHPQPVANRGAAPRNGTIAFASEDVAIAKHVADALCACKMPDCDRLDEKLGIPTATESYGLFIDMPSNRDDVHTPFQSSYTLDDEVHWCADQLRDWEVVRGQQCVQTAHGDTRPSMEGPRPTCDATAVLADGGQTVLEQPSIDSWWTAASACLPPARLVTEPNAIAPDKLVRARCVETDEHGVDHSSGRETTWHLNGVLRSDGTNKNGQPHGAWTWWYPHGLRAQEARYDLGSPAYRTGQWTAWFPSGQMAWQMEYAADGSMTGTELWPNGRKRFARGADGSTRWWTQKGKELTREQIARGYADEHPQ